MLLDLLARVEKMKADAEQRRGMAGQAQIRAQILEAVEGAELLLDALTDFQMAPYVQSTIVWDDGVPLELEGYRVSVAALGYTVGHGWHQKITDAELGDLVRQFAPDPVPNRPEQINAGSSR